MDLVNAASGLALVVKGLGHVVATAAPHPQKALPVQMELSLYKEEKGIKFNAEDPKHIVLNITLRIIELSRHIFPRRQRSSIQSHRKKNLSQVYIAFS